MITMVDRTDLAAKNIIKSILNIRCREGSTIDDIANDYRELNGGNWPYLEKSSSDVFDYLSSIESVYCERGADGVQRWFVESERTKHISKLIRKQKKPEKKYIQYKFPSNDASSNSTCFYKDNILYKTNKKKWIQQKTSSIGNPNAFRPKETKIRQTGSNIYSIGDQFSQNFLSYRNGIRLNNLCSVGFTIQSAVKRLEQIPEFAEIIINLGSVDILTGCELYNMCSDFDNLITICESRNIRPIITTLAPFPNLHSPTDLAKLHGFNNFLLDTYIHRYDIIDICSSMITASGQTLSELNCINQSIISWNSLSRRIIPNYKEKILCSYSPNNKSLCL